MRRVGTALDLASAQSAAPVLQAARWVSAASYTLSAPALWYPRRAYGLSHARQASLQIIRVFESRSDVLFHRTMGLIPGLCSSRNFAVMCPMPLHVLLLMTPGVGTSGRGPGGTARGARAGGKGRLHFLYPRGKAFTPRHAQLRHEYRSPARGGDVRGEQGRWRLMADEVSTRDARGRCTGCRIRSP